MIIKAGTYRFNDTISTPNDSIELNIPFSLSIEYMGMVAKASLNRISITGDEIPIVMLNIINSEVQPSNIIVEGNNVLPFYYLFPYYNSNWSDCKYSDEADIFAALTNIKDMPYDVSGIGQTFTVIEDTEVNDTSSYAWFTENTQMLIKAGTYKWNDVITKPTTQLEADLEYSTSKSATLEGIDGVISLTPNPNILAVSVDGGIVYQFYIINLQFTHQDGTITLPCQFLTVYSEEYGWSPRCYILENDLGIAQGEYELINLFGEEALGFGQIITVTEDTYVPTNFGLFATYNWQPYTEKTPAVEITYKDKVVTLFAGQTARLHNADGSAFGFEEDLVIKANKVETQTIVDSPLPVEVTTESEMTALLNTAEVGSVYKYMGESTDTYENGGLYIVEAVE